jgi:hypothetical protein
MKRIFLTAIAIAAASFFFSVSLQAQIRSTQSKKATNVKALQFPAENFVGNVNVGTGEATTSLTNPGGLFERMNAGTLSGNLVINITSNLTGETGQFSLEPPAETGHGGYSILIRPFGGSRLIEGSGTGLTLLTFGAHRVTVNGFLYGEKALTIRNTGYFGGAAITFWGGASNNVVTGCVLESTGDRLDVGVALITGSQVSANSIVGNTIRGWEPEFPHQQRVLVAVSGGSNTIVANNELSRYGNSFGGHAIYANGVRNLVVSGNTIFGNSQNPGGLTPIAIEGGSGTNVVSRNVIRDHFTYLFVGIYLVQNKGTLQISGNRIYDINSTCSVGCAGQFDGIEIRGDEPDSVVKITNNMIAYHPSIPNQWTMTAIEDLRSVGTLEVLHNTVLMSGTASQWHSWGFRRGSNSAVSVSMFGNIFFNDRTGGGNSFAVGDQSNGSGSWESDYNLYLGAGETPQNYFDRGTESVGTPVDFAAWKAGSSRDAHSITGLVETGLFTVENLFVSVQDLHLNSLGNNPAINAGTNTRLLTDFDGQIRPFGGVPDIGADEADATPAEALSVSGRVANAGGRGIRNARVTIQGGGLTAPITSMTSAFGYFSFNGLRRDDVYLVTVNAKRYVFSSPSRVCNLNESMTDVDFRAEP